MDNNTVILMVEDNPDDFEAAKKSLRNSGFKNKIYHTEDGDEALDFLFRRGKYENPESSPRPSVILLDLNLPGTDGRDVLEELKQDKDLKSIPVVVLTTSTDEKDISDCYALGANSYMSKPVNLQEFTRAIERLKGYWLEIAILPKE